MRNAWGTIFSLAAGFAFSGASAQQIDNLTPWKGSDFCLISSTTITIDGKEDLDYAKTVREGLANANILYGSPFSNEFFSPSCVLMNEFVVNAIKNGAGNYIYTFHYDVMLLSTLKVIPKANNQPSRAVPPVVLPSSVILWSTGDFGLALSLENLKEEILKTSRSEFEEFLLDWRKTHPAR